MQNNQVKLQEYFREFRESHIQKKKNLALLSSLWVIISIVLWVTGIWDLRTSFDSQERFFGIFFYGICMLGFLIYSFSGTGSTTVKKAKLQDMLGLCISMVSNKEVQKRDLSSWDELQKKMGLLTEVRYDLNVFSPSEYESIKLIKYSGDYDTRFLELTLNSNGTFHFVESGEKTLRTGVVFEYAGNL